MVGANDPNLLKEYGGDLVLTDNGLEECWENLRGASAKVPPEK